jgi:hypothetical protein
VEGGRGAARLRLTPGAAAAPGETHAALVLGPAVAGSFAYHVRLRTVEQLRRGAPPGPWEVAWVVWHYTDDAHFYYFVAKPNGWELGKRDPAYPGGQRFLATGTDPVRRPGAWLEVTVVQEAGARLAVLLDGRPVTTVVDAERPYPAGRVGLYTEDASVEIDHVQLAPAPRGTPR